MHLKIILQNYIIKALFVLFFLFWSSITFSQSNNTTSLFIEGIGYYNKGDLKKAEAKFRSILALDKEDDVAYHYLSNIYLQKNDVKRSLNYLLQAYELDGNNEIYASKLAMLYRYSNQPQKAIEIYNQIRERHPYKNELYDGLVELYLENKQFDKVQEVLDDIEKSIGKNDGIILTRYNILLYQNQIDSAISILKSHAQDYPSPRNLSILADYYASEQNDSLAYELYSRSLSLDPTFIPAKFGLAEIYRIKGEYANYFTNIKSFISSEDVDPNMKKAYLEQMLSNRNFVQLFIPQIDTLLQTLYETHPQDSSIAFMFALYSVQIQDDARALDVLLNNLNNHPKSIEAHRQYLSLTHYLSFWEEMEIYSNRAIESFPKNSDFIQFRAISLFQQGKIDDAIKDFKSILRISKDSATIVNSLVTIGDLYYKQGNIKQAYKYYRKTIKKEPYHLPALNNYAYFLAQENRQLKRAYQMSKKTIEKEPTNYTYLDTYAWILYKMGNYQEAKKAIQKAIGNGGKESADILDHYGDILYALGEKEVAIIYWTQANKLDPSLNLEKKINSKK